MSVYRLHSDCMSSQSITMNNVFSLQRQIPSYSTKWNDNSFQQMCLMVTDTSSSLVNTPHYFYNTTTEATEKNTPFSYLYCDTRHHFWRLAFDCLSSLNLQVKKHISTEWSKQIWTNADSTQNIKYKRATQASSHVSVMSVTVWEHCVQYHTYLKWRRLK